MSAAATAKAIPSRQEVPRPRTTTLLELVRSVGEVTEDDREVVATVLHMLRSGSVRLCGCMRDEPIHRFED